VKAAVQVVTREQRACSTNFLIAQVPDQVANVEAAPDRTRLLSPQDGYLVHTNHFLDPEALGVIEPPRERQSSSLHRLTRLRDLIAAKRPLTIEDIQSYLRDHQAHPNSLCCHEDPTSPPGERYRTVTSVVMDLHAQELHLSDGPPCQSRYQRVGL
jgi:isopenicillin-N N-acyltransferase-like protein